MVRSVIERQLKLGRVVSGLNFIGYEDNEVTEILTTAKHAQAIIAANNALIKSNAKNNTRRNILGPNLPMCNSYLPIWSNLETMTPQQQVNRTAHHIRRLVTQWHQCAQKYKIEEIKHYYSERIRQIKRHDMPLWKDLVQDIIVDDSLQAAPKVINETIDEHNEGAQKRKARAENGPVGQTPNSAERKPKELRQRTQDPSENNETKPVHNSTDPMDTIAEIANAGADRDDEPFETAASSISPTQPPQDKAITNQHAIPAKQPGSIQTPLGTQTQTVNTRRPLQPIAATSQNTVYINNNGKAAASSSNEQQQKGQLSRETSKNSGGYEGVVPSQC